MRRCSKCGLEKPIDAFYKRKIGLRKGEYYEKCKDCYRDWRREYYHENRERQSRLAILRNRRYKRERSEFVNEWKKDKPCQDCRKVYPPWVMDFDHREGEVKIGSVSSLTGRSTVRIERIKIEIEKCDLVCANCHRQRTYERMHRTY